MDSILKMGRAALAGCLMLAAATVPQMAVAQAQAQTAPAAVAAPPYLTVAQLRKLYADKQSRYVTIGGLKIHYKDEGPRN
ncbi:MAG: hypothetical protein ACOVQ0_12010, partial [Novosphingobium sp.]